MIFNTYNSTQKQYPLPFLAGTQDSGIGKFLPPVNVLTTTDWSSVFNTSAFCNCYTQL